MPNLKQTPKPRLLVLTDIGGDPDDQQTLVRLLVYANAFDIEGIIPEHWRDGHKRTPEDQMALAYQYLDAYGQVRDMLSQHADGYPSAETLCRGLKRGKTHISFSNDRATVDDVSDIIGPGLDTEGSEWIIKIVDKDDDRPVNVSVWGGTADLAQALDKVRRTRDDVALQSFISKLRVHAIGDQDDTGPWIRANFPTLFYVLDHARDGNKMHSCYRGMFIGGDESLTSRAWIDTHIRQGHGPLGVLYPPETWTGPNPHGALKEGDTPSWFYFYRNGLHVPARPDFGGWGGRFAPQGTYYRDAMDTVGEITSGRATVWRWRPAFQRDFQARLDWCVSTYDAVNHNPVAIVNGDDTQDVVFIDVAPGSSLILDATGSYDPDGDTLIYHWWVYSEAGTYPGKVAIAGSNTQQARVVVPQDASGTTLHVILELTDEGAPPLTSYRRVVIMVQEE